MAEPSSDSVAWWHPGNHVGLTATLLFFGVVLIRVLRVSQASPETMGYLLQSDPSAIVLSVATSFIPPAFIGAALLVVGAVQDQGPEVRLVAFAFVAWFVLMALSSMPAPDDLIAVIWTAFALYLLMRMMWILLSEEARAKFGRGIYRAVPWISGSKSNDDEVRTPRPPLALGISIMAIYFAMPQLVSPSHWQAHEVITTNSATVVGPVLGQDGTFYTVLDPRSQVVLIPIETVISREVCRPSGTAVRASAIVRVSALLGGPLPTPEYDDCPDV